LDDKKNSLGGCYMIANIFYSFFISCTSQEEGKINVEEAVVKETVDSVLIGFNEKIKRNPNDPALYYERAKYFFENQPVPVDWGRAWGRHVRPETLAGPKCAAVLQVASTDLLL
jgi:hypothetical protein